MPKSNDQQRVLIVGAGIAGLATAWWLERTGWEVLVVERAPAFRAGGYMIDFFGPGHEVARRMGLLPALEARQAPISSVTSVDPRGRKRSEISAEAYEAVADGAVSLLRGDLAEVIRDDVRAEFRYGTTVSAIDDGRVTFSDGSVDEFDLIVGADGVHSRVRELVFGPSSSSFVRYLGHHTAAFSFRDTELSARIGHRYQMLTVPHRMIGCYAVRDGAMAALMLYRSADQTLPADPAAALRDRFGDLGWVVPELLSVVPQDIYYDEVSQVDMPVWHRGKVVLVGDACGAVSLFAGHGASLAMTGAFVLAEELAAGPDAFSRYEARMKPVVARTQEFGQKFIGWMAPSSRWRISLRDLAFRLSGLPVVRNMIRGSVMPDVDGVLTPSAPAGTAA